MTKLVKQFLNDEEGQDLVEYALLLVFLASIGGHRGSSDPRQ